MGVLPTCFRSMISIIDLMELAEGIVEKWIQQAGQVLETLRDRFWKKLLRHCQGC